MHVIRASPDDPGAKIVSKMQLVEGRQGFVLVNGRVEHLGVVRGFVLLMEGSLLLCFFFSFVSRRIAQSLI